MPSTLICTVGGSHQPILRAIEENRPDQVCFVCSEDDPATGRKGSYVQVEGRGAVIKAHPDDAKPTLPNIPAQAGLGEGQYEVLRVPADAFEAAYARIVGWLEARRGQPGRVVADYTGGTKSMSAALVAAALDVEGVELELVTGPRVDLVKVASGEQAVPASVEHVRLRRRLREAVSLWRHHGYAEAAELLDPLRAQDPTLRAELMRARALSTAFADWDRFDHETARQRLDGFRSVLGPVLPELLGAVDALCREGPAQEPLRIFDLWRNAGRRAAQGRYDDAVARLYRVTEWSAQWLLRAFAGIDTADVPGDRVPEGLALTPNREGRLQAGLFAAWALAAAHCGEDVRAFWDAEHDALLHLLQHRNTSILAHGFRPVDQAGWRAFDAWVQGRLMPLLLGRVGDRQRFRIRRLPPQLPTEYPFTVE